MRPPLEFSGPLAADGIDPAPAPKRTPIPAPPSRRLGLGTFGSDHVTPERIAEAVEGAIAVDYRHLDCASVYGNENTSPRFAERLFNNGLRRVNSQHAM